MTNENDPTEMDHDGPTPARGDSERRAMDNPTRAPGGRAGRTLLVTAAAVVALALAASAAAWACTLRDGVTLKVFRTPTYSSCANAGAYCSKAVGNGAQTGLATVDTAGDDVLSISGSGFTDTTADLAYSITWRHPGSSGNCHRTNTDGSIVLMGGSATVTSTGTLDVTRTAIRTASNDPVGPPPLGTTGLVRICVQDYEFGDTSTVTPTPTVVVGQIVDISVV